MTSLDTQLRFAIENKRLIEISYHGSRRQVEPHDYGVHNGAEKLLVFQQRLLTPSTSGRATGWRLLDVSKIEACAILDERFRGSRGESHEKHLRWDTLYARV